MTTTNKSPMTAHGFTPKEGGLLARMIDASQDGVSDELTDEQLLEKVSFYMPFGEELSCLKTFRAVIAADRALQKTLWTHCVFDGPPPDGYTDWHAFVNAPVKTGVTVRKTAEKQAPAVPVEMPVVAYHGSTGSDEHVNLKENFLLRNFDPCEVTPEPLVFQSDALAALAAKDAEIERLGHALTYVAHQLHSTPQYMLCKGVTLIDNNRVKVSIDGWTVSAAMPGPNEATPPKE